MHHPLAKPVPHNDYQKFRPRYPLDPFQDSDKKIKHGFDHQVTPKEPWRLDVDKLPPVDLTKLCRTVVLILGGQFNRALASTLSCSNSVLFGRASFATVTTFTQIAALLLLSHHNCHSISGISTRRSIAKHPNPQTQWVHRGRKPGCRTIG